MAAERQQGTLTLRERLEFFATLLTIATCLFVCVLLVLRITGAEIGTAVSPASVPVGSVLKLPAEITAPATDLTVVVGLSSNCRFCTESMPAFRVLDEFVRSRGRGKVRVIALSAESPEVIDAYLQQQGLAAFQPTNVKSDSEIARAVARTPTLVLLDRAGRVVAARSGKMTPAQMKEFITRNFRTLISG